MTTPKGHSVGNQPTDPIITDTWVYRISNILQEHPPEDDGLVHWSYDVNEQISIVDYTKRRESEITEMISVAQATAEVNAFEAVLELLGE